MDNLSQGAEDSTCLLPPRLIIAKQTQPSNTATSSWPPPGQDTATEGSVPHTSMEGRGTEPFLGEELKPHYFSIDQK